MFTIYDNVSCLALLSNRNSFTSCQHGLSDYTDSMWAPPKTVMPQYCTNALWRPSPPLLLGLCYFLCSYGRLVWPRVIGNTGNTWALCSSAPSKTLLELSCLVLSSLRHPFGFCLTVGLCCCTIQHCIHTPPLMHAPTLLIILISHATVRSSFSLVLSSYWWKMC